MVDWEGCLDFRWMVSARRVQELLAGQGVVHTPGGELLRARLADGDERLAYEAAIRRGYLSQGDARRPAPSSCGSVALAYWLTCCAERKPFVSACRSSNARTDSGSAVEVRFLPAGDDVRPSAEGADRMLRAFAAAAGEPAAYKLGNHCRFHNVRPQGVNGFLAALAAIATDPACVAGAEPPAYLVPETPPEVEVRTDGSFQQVPEMAVLRTG